MILLNQFVEIIYGRHLDSSFPSIPWIITIHRNAWNRNSANFAFWGFSEVAPGKQVCYLVQTLHGEREREGMCQRHFVLAAMALALLLASGVALAVNKIGTNGPDTLMGTDGNDNLIGRGGNDKLFALNGRDNLLGGRGKDYIDTHPTRVRSGNRAQGGPGNDIVVGGAGFDNVLDDAGNDFLIDDGDPKLSLDKLSGGDGNDVFSVRTRASVQGHSCMRWRLRLGASRPQRRAHPRLRESADRSR